MAAEIFERDRNFANAFMRDSRVREQLATLFFDRATRRAVDTQPTVA